MVQTANLTSAYTDLDILKKDIRNLLAGAGAPCEVMNKVAVRLQTFGKAGLLQTISVILNNETFLNTVASQSYLHGNGFYKIVLAEEDDFVIRTNIWMPGVHAEENLHDHRWHLASTIIDGTLESEIWEEAASPTAAEYEEYIYVGKTAQKEAYTLPIGKSKISLKERTVHRAGECYNLSSNIMHRIVSSGKDLTCTLMCHPTSARTWGRVIPLKPLEPDLDRAYLTNKEMTQLFQQYLTICDRERRL